MLRFTNMTVANPVKYSNPLIDSRKGSAIILTNWHGKPTKNLVVTLPRDLEKKKLSRASGRSFPALASKTELSLNVEIAIT